MAFMSDDLADLAHSINMQVIELTENLVREARSRESIPEQDQSAAAAQALPSEAFARSHSVMLMLLMCVGIKFCIVTVPFPAWSASRYL